jgi:hypothetical protein
MPDYSNDATRLTEQKFGAFIFDKEDSPVSAEIIERGPFELDNGAVYHG